MPLFAWMKVSGSVSVGLGGSGSSSLFGSKWSGVDLGLALADHPQAVQGHLEAVELVHRRFGVDVGVVLALDLGLKLLLPPLRS